MNVYTAPPANTYGTWSLFNFPLESGRVVAIPWTNMFFFNDESNTLLVAGPNTTTPDLAFFDPRRPIPSRPIGPQHNQPDLRPRRHHRHHGKLHPK
jgi:hypothetical protein